MSLLNLVNVPNQQISGLNDEMLNFVSKESGDRYVLELSDQFFEELQETDTLPVLSATELDELTKLEKSNIPKSTLDQTKRHVESFRKFLEGRSLCTAFETVPENILNDYLRLFYANLRTKDQKYYSASSLICIRAAIHRHLTSVDVNRNINILHGDSFVRANSVLKSMVGLYLRSDQEKGKQFNAISPGDMSRLTQYFDRSTHKRIQEEVIFSLIYFFGMRGRENLRSLKKDTFGIFTDGEQKKYVGIQKLLPSKNVKASLNVKEFNDIKNTRMYSTSDKQTCPVECFTMYLNLLPENTFENTLFPKCTKNSFSSMALLGKDSLGNFMKTVSKNANLKNIYTNHCIRVSVVTILQEKGIPNEEIAKVTGHKNPMSVHRYSRHRKDDKLQLISDHLNSEKSNSGTSKKKTYEIAIENRTSNESMGNEVYEYTCANINQNFHESVTKENVEPKFIFSNCTFNNCTF